MTTPTTLFTTIGIAAAATALAALAGCNRPSGPPAQPSIDGKAAQIERRRELARRFQALVAMQLRHMDREEREVNAVFWAHLDDRDLGALTRRIVVSIPPARLIHWQQQVLMPAWSAPEIAAAAARQPSPI